jgi:hypothetical protein
VTITLKRKMEIEVVILVDEDGEIARAHLPNLAEFNEAARAYFDLPLTKAELVKAYAQATRSRIDEGFIRLWASSFHGRSMSYLKIGKLTRTMLITESGRRYKREGGGEVGVQYGRDWLDDEDLKALNSRPVAASKGPRAKR